MARITVADCTEKVENPFDLALLAAKRAYQISNGSISKVPLDNDKPVVVALREIAENVISVEAILEEENAMMEKLVQPITASIPETSIL